MDLSKYQALIFDMDGTLIDSMPAHLGAWRRTCEAFGIPFDQEWLHSLGGMPTKKTARAIIERYQLDVQPQLLVETKFQYYEATEHKGVVIPATVDLLKQFRHEKKTAVGTGCIRRHADELLTMTELLPLLDAVVTASDVIRYKPEPDTFLLAAERVGVKPQDCVVFEDTNLGRQAALAAGMDCILVKNGELVEFTKA
ncbi:carotenoid dehydrogenase [Photobacterium jeanii]|uniref:Carotenoid dehydrogenase n=1 Tax=Photobacterium jeanii TaxID=858640 RepID=A0A178KN31_9GAMM|nr:beta-phosphoglucomutase family hydrolase [Photobacterium jeanii]OAN18083.1 carotenoid dehydrogenase [Photobacterium jeanii]PST92244.1 beta-phosphoglucomutase family hydrolase [Photobacterium jeanii]